MAVMLCVGMQSVNSHTEHGTSFLLSHQTQIDSVVGCMSNSVMHQDKVSNLFQPTKLSETSLFVHVF